MVISKAWCYGNLNELIGCYRAVDGALGFTGDLKLTAAQLKAGEVLVHPFGLVKLVRSAGNDSVTSVYAFWQALIAQRDRDVQILAAHFRDPQTRRINFHAIVEFIKTLMSPEKESELTARGIY
ncbi:MAG: hypothetical protein ABI619_11415 [Betaproteobacteria bacterium]